VGREIEDKMSRRSNLGWVHVIEHFCSDSVECAGTRNDKLTPHVIKERYYIFEYNVLRHARIPPSSFFPRCSRHIGSVASSAARGVQDEPVSLVGCRLHFAQEECRHFVLHSSGF